MDRHHELASLPESSQRATCDASEHDIAGRAVPPRRGALRHRATAHRASTRLRCQRARSAPDGCCAGRAARRAAAQAPRAFVSGPLSQPGSLNRLDDVVQTVSGQSVDVPEERVPHKVPEQHVHGSAPVRDCRHPSFVEKRLRLVTLGPTSLIASVKGPRDRYLPSSTGESKRPRTVEDVLRDGARSASPEISTVNHDARSSAMARFTTALHMESRASSLRASVLMEPSISRLPAIPLPPSAFRDAAPANRSSMRDVGHPPG